MKPFLQNSFPCCIPLVLILSLLSILFPDKTAAQEIEPTYISISQGLADPNVQDVIQDSYGLLWIGTGNGLQSYDGYRFETFKNIPGNPRTLLSSVVWGLAEDADGNIWVSTDKGIARYNRMTKSFSNYNFLEKFNLTGNNGLVFNLFMDSQKRLWATTMSKEVLLYNPNSDQWDQAIYSLNDTAQLAQYGGLVLGIAEDVNGTLWAGSSNYGLMYRGTNDSTFSQATIKNTDYLSFTDPYNLITGLYADSTNVIWITTRSGVYKYYPQDSYVKTIEEYDYSRENVWNHWNSIQPDPEGNILIANNYRGLLKFDGISDRYREVPISGAFKLKTVGWNITLTDFTIDKSGIYWIGNRSLGLIKYDPEKKPFVHYSHDETNPASLSNDAVFGLLASSVKPGILYVGTRGFGLNIFDQQKQTFRQIKYKAINDYYGGAVRSIKEDPDGTLWLGTWGDGLIELDQNYNEIRRYTYSPNSPTSISDDKVRVIKGDKAGNFWIGTNNGLNYFEPKTGKFKRIYGRQSRTYPKELIEEIEGELLSENKIGDILKVTDYQNLTQTIEIKEAGEYLAVSVGEGTGGAMADYGWIENAQQDTIWTSIRFNDTYYAGGAAKNRILIDRITLSAGTYLLRYFSDDSHSYDKWNEAAPDLTSLYGIALLKLNVQEEGKSIEKLMKQNDEQQTISGVSITAISVADDHIWLGTADAGLNRIDFKNNEVMVYSYDPVNENSLNSNAIFDVYEDESGLVWIATDAGICTFDLKTEKFTRYTEEDGLPTNLTECILPGDNGEMWISTQSGLSQMVMNESLGKVTFINFNSADGLGGDVFLSQAAARTADGKFYFGGDHGLNAVSRITANHVPPDLILTDLLISNKSVYESGDDSPVMIDLINLTELNLSYDQNSLSFEFAALHYANPQKNQYAHMLKGYDKDWVYDNRNYASYTNLDPGTYEFVIRASNAYGVWNEEGKTLRIIIAAPWYRTWWAYAAYSLLFLLCLFIFDRVMRRRLILQERKRSQEKELQQAREIEKAYRELKETQSQLIQSEKMASLGELTAGIAHEIQNPLNFVNNFADVSNEMIGEMNEELEKGDIQAAKELAVDIGKNLEKIHFHGHRASSIVKGMLEHSRTGNGQKVPTDINALADEYLRLAYHGLRAKDKSFQSDFKTEFDEKLPKIQVVPQDIGRVILNLINNAFYVVDKKAKSGVNNYKPEVIATTKKLKNIIEISVKDNGDGIPTHVRDKIFQPFFTTKPTGQGTGLGLSLSYDIVKAHGGELKVETKEGVGSEFIIQLPVV